MLTDLHCHLLPGIDDGARDLEQALAMARLALDDQITTTVTTPHHLNGVYKNPADFIRGEVERMRAVLEKAEVPLKLLPGSEVHLTPEVPDALANDQALTIADRGRAVLIELPVHTVPVGAEQLLEQIMAQQLTPVIAHPERNSELRQHPERLADWVQMGCLGQVTAQSCSGKFGEPVRQAAKQMILDGSIHVIASDAHRDKRRIPAITPARESVEQWTSAEIYELLSLTYPTQLANGETPNRTPLNRALAELKPERWWKRLFTR